MSDNKHLEAEDASPRGLGPLIAAAPDMYGMLDKIANISYGEYGHDTEWMLSEIIGWADQALTKARGE